MTIGKISLLLAAALLPGGILVAQMTPVAAASVPGCTRSGTDRNDVVRGTPGRDVLCGLLGDDSLIGFNGDDVLRGDAVAVAACINVLQGSGSVDQTNKCSNTAIATGGSVKLVHTDIKIIQG